MQVSLKFPLIFLEVSTIADLVDIIRQINKLSPTKLDEALGVTRREVDEVLDELDRSMFLQIKKSVKTEVVKGKILSAIPEWDLRPGYVIIGTYGSVQKQEQDLLQSVGSPTSDIPYGSEFRFAKDNLLLKRIWVNAPEENLESSDEIEKWLNLEPVEGLLRLLSPEMFEDKRSDYRWMSPDGKLLAGIDDIDLIESDNKFRLRVAQDFDL